MRILQLHCDHLQYTPIEKEIDSAEETTTETRTVNDCVLLLVSVEKGDDDSVASQAVDCMRNAQIQLKCDSFVVYPYAHLSSDLASPKDALALLRSVEQKGREQAFSIHHVPFGWNKSFSVKVKGHPLAEQSRVLHSLASGKQKAEKEIMSAALSAEDNLKSQWCIIDLDGNLTSVTDYNFAKHKNLERLKNYETAKVRAVQEAPPHVSLMKKLGVADHEPASDPGNMRYYPKGRMIKSLLERYVTQRVSEYGGLEVETPLMYDLEHPSLASYLNRFPARQYLVKSDDKEYFLRFAACFGQFLMAKDLQLSYKQLPLKLYELTRYSFRREKSGELVGLRRLRAFTMPDCHAIVRNMDQAKEEFPKRFELSQSVLKGIGFDQGDYELAIRFTEDFYKENKEFIAEIIRMHGRPALVEMWKERIFYFVLKWEFNYVDNLGKASALSTDQIDIENAQRYGITFVDESGRKESPLILHNSPSGAVERCIFGLLENAGRAQKEGKVATLPTWLCPTHVRLIPVSQRFMGLAESIVRNFNAGNVRADLDDREESVGKRIRDAEKEWVPYVIVIGEKEESDVTKLPVRVRAKGATVEMNTKSLIEEISAACSGKPFLPLPLPMLVSKRPSFETIS
ncbi:MAG: threonine--tRNA ligase [Thaumarchaeota archaeon]|nr:threonine--tRNA ligase [Nitrososphaerota archaeon]